MFIYNLKVTDTLLNIAKNRDYVQNNPDLCPLLENPLLKDDTELAIRYNEYLQGYPDAGKSFVDYYYMHGPELDPATLIEWNEKISRDPGLCDQAMINNQNISIIQQEKKKNKDISWLTDVIDCLSNPCQYLSPISEMIGTALSETTAKYNLKNNIQGNRPGVEGNNTKPLVTSGLPEYIRNKLPKCITDGCDQLCEMIRQNTEDVCELIKSKAYTVKEDPFIFANAELIGGEIIADLASKLGDCFRMLEYKKRYNPYDYNKNKAEGNRFGIVVYDASGNPRTVTPTGSPVGSRQPKKMNDNIRLSPDGTYPKISESSLDLENISNDGFVPFALTYYNGFITSDYSYYHDGTIDQYSDKGQTCTNKYGILPNNYNELKNTKVEGQYIFVPDRRLFTFGAGTRPESIKNYFEKLFAKKYPNLKNQLPKTITEKLSMVQIQEYILKGDLRVILKYPTKTVDMPIIDSGSGEIRTAVTGQSKALGTGFSWVDVTSLFYTLPGYNDIAKLTLSGTNEVLNAIPVTYDQDRLKNAKDKGLNKPGIVNFSINGTTEKLYGLPSVPGLFYFKNRDYVKNILGADDTVTEILCNPESRYLASVPSQQNTIQLDNSENLEDVPPWLLDDTSSLEAKAEIDDSIEEATPISDLNDTSGLPDDIFGSDKN